MPRYDLPGTGDFASPDELEPMDETEPRRARLHDALCRYPEDSCSCDRETDDDLDEED